MKNLSVAFLILNENESLKKTIEKAYIDIKKITDDFELWIFDNNSLDGSDKTVNDLMQNISELKLYRQKSNVGYAQNLNSAISQMKAKHMFVVDGDGQYDLSDIMPAINLLENNNDVVFGIRQPRKDPLMRILMSFFLNLLSRFILSSKLKDINCGFRGFTYEASRKIKINYRYNFAGPEVYIMSKINELKVCEMKVKHYNRIAGISYFNGIFKIIKSSLDMVKYLFQLRKILKKK